ncbi:MAG: ATP-binding protein, partial [Anaerolineales bacterium]|nr:ATP-binding protein [Anaerolineales bacterium]
GLYSVRRILERHGTTIQVESRPGQGARFSFRLPTA